MVVMKLVAMMIEVKFTAIVVLNFFVMAVMEVAASKWRSLRKGRYVCIHPIYTD